MQVTDMAKMTSEELRSLLITHDYKGEEVKRKALKELERRAWEQGAWQQDFDQDGEADNG